MVLVASVLAPRLDDRVYYLLIGQTYGHYRAPISVVLKGKIPPWISTISRK